MIELPTGRVSDTAHRDLMRALMRAGDPGPARPTKTLGGGPAALSATAAETTAADEPAALRLVGGWSLTTDDTGALLAVHDDGTRAVLAERDNPGTTHE